MSCGGGGLDIIPITLNPMMRRLSLKDNRIKIVDASLNFYTQLEEVDFSGNLMEALPDRGFFKQRKLLELRLDNNRIRNITNSTAFVGLQSLLRLSLKGNRLESIPSRVFDFLPKVCHVCTPLSLSHTKCFFHLVAFFIHVNRLDSHPSMQSDSHVAYNKTK